MKQLYDETGENTRIFAEKSTAALYYTQIGWPVFPVHNALANGVCSCHVDDCGSPAKHPRTTHGKDDATTDTQQIENWWRKWPDANVAIRTGEPSGFLVLDVDAGKDGFESLAELERKHGALPATRTAYTGGGGEHRLFEMPPTHIGNSVEKLGKGLDVRANGGYIVAPPSDHASGNNYCWKDDTPIAPLPDWLLTLLTAEPARPQPVGLSKSSFSGGGNRYAERALESAVRNVASAANGIRNHTLNREAFGLGQLVGSGLLKENDVVTQLESAALHAGLKLSEIQATILSGISAGKLEPRGVPEPTNTKDPKEPKDTKEPEDNEDGGGKREKRTQVDALIDVASTADFFFCVEEDEAYVSVLVNDPKGSSTTHQETYRVNSKAFRQYLSRAYWLAEKKTPNNEALQNAVSHLAGQARFEGEHRPVYLRLAPHEGRIYWDLCNREWQILEISSTDWRIIEAKDAPIRFRRTRGMLPLATPVKGGKLETLKRFINYPDDAAWVLHATWLVAALRANARAFPVLIINGEQGAAKSTACKITRRLIDPNTADLRPKPREDRDLYIAANNSWVCGFDNLSGLSRDLSDSICRIATGAGFGGRELFSDADETLFQVARPVMLNGIDDLADKADLIDRGVFIELPPIPEEERKDEDTLWRDFDAAQPSLLGALADAVVIALRELPKVKLTKLPRMADFMKWGVAAGIGGDEVFEKAYTNNRTKANQDTLRANDIAECLVKWYSEEEGVVTTDLTKLLTQLTNLCRERLATKLGTDPKRVRLPDGWPTTERKLSNELRRCSPNLRRAGIEVSDAGLDPESRKARRTFCRIVVPPTGATFDPSEASVPAQALETAATKQDIAEASSEGLEPKEYTNPSDDADASERRRNAGQSFGQSFGPSFAFNGIGNQQINELIKVPKETKVPIQPQSESKREVFSI